MKTAVSGDSEPVKPVAKPKVAMIFVAHPDDAEFGSAGSAAAWSREGWDVYYTIMTDGGSGGDDHATDVGPEARRKMSEIRKGEQRDAGRILGLKDVIFLDYPDGTLEPTLELRRDIVRLIRQYKVDRVVCQSPEWGWEHGYSIGRNHPDHLAGGTAVLRAIYPAPQNAWDFPELLAEGLEPYKVNELLVVGAPYPNYAVDISDTLDLKIEALRAHKSQIQDPTGQLATWIRRWASSRAARYGLDYVEEFHRATQRWDEDD